MVATRWIEPYTKKSDSESTVAFMPDTDGPLKRLVETSATDFAEWLLGAEVREIQAINVERPADAVRVDQLYRVTLASGKQTLFHIEKALDGVEDEAKLERLLAAAIRTDSIEGMLTKLGEEEVSIEMNGASLAPAEGQP
jgi:hypothetical protein